MNPEHSAFSAGVPIYIIQQNGLKAKSTAFVEKKASGLKDSKLIWRSGLGCELSFINLVSKSEDNTDGIVVTLEFPEFKLCFEVCNTADAAEVFTELCELWRKSQSASSHELLANQHNSLFLQTVAMKNGLFRTAMLQERLHQLAYTARCREVIFAMEKHVEASRQHQLRHMLNKWINFVKIENSLQLSRDKLRWRLHAAANEDLDLQGWYHGLFYQQVSSYCCCCCCCCCCCSIVYLLKKKR
jgi:hypothetical protein